MYSAATGGLFLALSAAPAALHAESPAKARLVHCVEGTCLRLSGQRSGSDVSVRVAGRELAVAGTRRWTATIPLASARSWLIDSGHSVTVSLVDARIGVQTDETVLLPPGAFAGRLELASLVVRAY